jgi:hypothetical protein
MNIYKIDIEDMDYENGSNNSKLSIGCKELKKVGDTTLIADEVIIVIQGYVKNIEKTMEE